MDTRPYSIDSASSTLSQPPRDPPPDLLPHPHLSSQLHSIHLQQQQQQQQQQQHQQQRQQQSRFNPFDSRQSSNFASSSSSSTSAPFVAPPSSEEQTHDSLRRYQQKQRHQQGFYSSQHLEIDSNPFSHRHTLNSDTSDHEPSRPGFSDSIPPTDSRRSLIPYPSHSIPPLSRPIRLDRDSEREREWDRERERVSERGWERESVTSGSRGRGYSGIHQDEPLHVLSSVAQQQQQQQQHQYTHQSHNHQQGQSQYYLGENRRELYHEPHRSIPHREDSHITSPSPGKDRASQLDDANQSNLGSIDLSRPSSTLSLSVHHQSSGKDKIINNPSPYNGSYPDEPSSGPYLDHDQPRETTRYHRNTHEDPQDENRSRYHQYPHQPHAPFPPSQDRRPLSDPPETIHNALHLASLTPVQRDIIPRHSIPFQHEPRSHSRPLQQHHQQEPYSIPPASHSTYDASNPLSPPIHPQQSEPIQENTASPVTHQLAANRTLVPHLHPTIQDIPRSGHNNNYSSTNTNQGTDHNGTLHDSSYDSNPENDDERQEFDPDNHNYQVKFGTDLPNTVDLRSAIESSDTLCRFALHYSRQPNDTYNDMGLLSPDMRANLQKIRYMNSTMLIGLPNMNSAKNEKVTAPSEGQGGTGEELPVTPGRGDRNERETSPIIFDENGQPPHELVHELAKVGTSIFQLAIRIKAWIGMTPEQRELDEDINMIRGKRCLLMDSTLTSAKVDHHGNVKKDWAVIPAASSTSKSFYERQRDLDQQRPTLGQILGQKQNYQLSQLKQGPNGDNSSRNKSQIKSEEQSSRRSSNGGNGQNPRDSYTDNASSSYSSDSNVSRSSRGGRNNSGAESSMSGRTSKDGEVPYQKYRKRAKRTQPPGRCLSCDSSDTPEWRRGPDGARTLCNACGLHYAKLLKRQNAKGPQIAGSPVRSGLIPGTARLGITLPPSRRLTGSQSLELMPTHDSGPSAESISGRQRDSITTTQGLGQSESSTSSSSLSVPDGTSNTRAPGSGSSEQAPGDYDMDRQLP
ncbi:hypothetical protein BGZ76_006180 [Entomortierella beljakovae]|nr:hypothetical protein BGZ76_006180 [Entomortierella beljakovae]